MRPHTKYCLQHNLGLGGAVVVTVYCRPDRSEAPSAEVSKESEGKIDDGRKWAGYNPAVEARWLTNDDLQRVMSRKKVSQKMLEDRERFEGYLRSRL